MKIVEQYGRWKLEKFANTDGKACSLTAASAATLMVVAVMLDAYRQPKKGKLIEVTKNVKYSIENCLAFGEPRNNWRLTFVPVDLWKQMT